MKKSFLTLIMVVTLIAILTACGKKSDTQNNNSDNSTQENNNSSVENENSNTDFKIAMITDTGGVNDQSFNESAWEGLTKLKNDLGVSVGYIESVQETDYITNFDKAVDNGNDLIWGVGFATADALETAAAMNPEVHFGIIDNSYDEPKDNVTCVMFRAQEPSFLVGYIAGKTTETNKVGFVGGFSSVIIDQFEYGYRAGVEYAAKELGKKIDIVVQYAESFTDAAKGKAIATKMYAEGADIIFHAAGGVGGGIIETAKEKDKFAIGVDRDQAYLAPDNVLTSALKLVNVAIELVSKDAIEGKDISGKTYTYGLKEDAVGIPTDNPNMAPEVYEAALELQQTIKDGTVTPPYSEETYKAFVEKYGL